MALHNRPDGDDEVTVRNAAMPCVCLDSNQWQLIISQAVMSIPLAT